MSNVIKIDASPDVITEEALRRNLSRNEFAAGVVTITPAIAKYILEYHNVMNRALKPRHVARYARDMAEGKWMLTGDTLKFGHGRLLDGQNRLKGCTVAKKPFTTVAVFGIERELFHKMDTGKNRDGADILQIADYGNCRRLAAALRWAKMWDDDAVPTRRTFTPTEILEIAKEVGPMINEIKAASAIYSLNRFPIGIGAALYREFAKRNPEKTKQFFSAWAQGVYKGRFRVLEKLNIALAQQRERTSGRVHEFVYMAYAIAAWNAFLQGKVGTAKTFVWDIQRDEIPEIEG